MRTLTRIRRRPAGELPAAPPRDTAAEAAKMRGYIPHYISRLMNILNLRLLDTLRLYGVTIQQFRVMQVLDARGVASVGEISADAIIEQSVVSRIIDQLERDNLAVRTKRKGNSRIVDVYLTPLGSRTYSELFPAARAIVDDAVGALSKSERKILEELLIRMFDHLRRPHEPWLQTVARTNSGRQPAGAPRPTPTRSRALRYRQKQAEPNAPGE